MWGHNAPPPILDRVKLEQVWLIMHCRFFFGETALQSHKIFHNILFYLLQRSLSYRHKKKHGYDVTPKFTKFILFLIRTSFPMQVETWFYIDSGYEVNRQQPRSARLRPIQKIPTPIKLLISPLPEMINQICKKYSLEKSQEKKTSDNTCDIFQR